MTAAPFHPDYEVVIGLEVHTHLRTKSKLFSPAPVAYGEPPNHSVHPVCLALPGVLPVLNRRAVELAIRAGLAVHGEIRRHSVFARKNYFYPDLPKGYQISQYEEPVIDGGWIDIAVDEGGETEAKRVSLTRIHMEEDAGKSIHDAAIAGDATHVDLNRAGVPLLEIVSEPEMRSPAEAVAYLRALRSVLRYIDVSDADMERGHFRCDVNISLRPHGSEALGTRTEIKNLNSFRSVEAALGAEITRQAELLDDGGDVVQATMAFDPETGRTRVLRLKENADDYRYFPDPDLVPLVISEEQIESVRVTLPELADARCERFQREFELPESTALAVTGAPGDADFYEAAVRAAGTGHAKAVANWYLRDAKRSLNDRDIEIEDAAVTPEAFGVLVKEAEEGRVTAKSARSLIPELMEQGGDPLAMIRERGLEALTDSSALEEAVDAVIAENAEDVERVRAGEQKVLNFLMGQVMKRTGGKADAKTVRAMLAAKISP